MKKLFDQIVTFHKDLLSNRSGTSSKRYIMVESSYMLCILALLNQIFGLNVDLVFPVLFACIATGTAILTVIELFKK